MMTRYTTEEAQYIEALANHPISYDDQIVRQVLESVIVESKEKIKVVFVGGLEVTQLM